MAERSEVGGVVRSVGIVILSVSEESQKESQKTCNQTLHYVQGDRSNVILSVSEESQIPHSTFRTHQSLPCVKGGDTACRDVGVVILSVSEESRISKTCHQTLHYVQGDNPDYR